jgi:hypothetical protein
MTALQSAVQRRRPAAGLFHHCDRGCQYTSAEYRTRLETLGVTVSMNRTGNCWDNAVAESFSTTLKRELVDRRRWHRVIELRNAIFEYIEVFYNRRRLHSSLNYETPALSKWNSSKPHNGFNASEGSPRARTAHPVEASREGSTWCLAPCALPSPPCSDTERRFELRVVEPPRGLPAQRSLLRTFERGALCSDGHSDRRAEGSAPAHQQPVLMPHSLLGHAALVPGSRSASTIVEASTAPSCLSAMLGLACPRWGVSAHRRSYFVTGRLRRRRRLRPIPTSSTDGTRQRAVIDRAAPAAKISSGGVSSRSRRILIMKRSFFVHGAIAIAAALASIVFDEPARAQTPEPFKGPENWAVNQGGWTNPDTWLAGNFHQYSNVGSHAKDLALIWNDGGNIQIDIHGSNAVYPGTRTFSLYSGEGASGTQGLYPQSVQWVVGDFNHDGVDDIADLYDSNGQIQIDVHERDEYDFGFTLKHYNSNQGGWVTGVFVAGDFDNDGWDDIALVWDDNGGIDIDVHVNTHAESFSLQRWSTGQGGWIGSNSVLAGNFDGKSGTDIAYVFPATQDYLANIDVHLSLGSMAAGGFSGPDRWLSTTPFNDGLQDQGQWMSGDMNGDGLSDITTTVQDYECTDIQCYGPFIDLNGVQSTGTGFTPSYYYATFQGSYPKTVTFLAADYDGDGLADVADAYENPSNLINIDVHSIH